MFQRLDALKARILVVAFMFLGSACVIQRATDQKTGDEPVQPAAPPASKAEPEKAETAVAKAPPAPGAKPAVAQPKPAVVQAKATQPKPQAAAVAAPKAGDKKLSRVARYVGVENLNVRSRADAHAPIIGRLARGSMVTVSVDGAWARIGDAQFVAVKHLTKTQPQGKRLVSRK